MERDVPIKNININGFKSFICEHPDVSLAVRSELMKIYRENGGQLTLPLESYLVSMGVESAISQDLDEIKYYCGYLEKLADFVKDEKRKDSIIHGARMIKERLFIGNGDREGD